MEESKETLELRNKILRTNLDDVVRQNDMLRDMLEGKNKRTNREVLQMISDEVLLYELERRLKNNRLN